MRIPADDTEYSRGAGSDSEHSATPVATGDHSHSTSEGASGELSPTALKGNIIEQLRTKVRREAKQAPPAVLPPPPSTLLQKRQRSASVTSQSGDEGDGFDDDLEWDGHVPGHEDVADDGAELILVGAHVRGAPAGEDLASYKKERNRVHAKLTRDRKKIFTCRLQQMIASLEQQNSAMRRQLVAEAGHDRTTVAASAEGEVTSAAAAAAASPQPSTSPGPSP